MRGVNERDLPNDLRDVKNSFEFINPSIPEIGPFSQHNSFERTGRLVRDVGGPNDSLQFKEFDFEVPFGPHGWNYFYFKLSLQRLAPAGQRATAQFFVDYAARSYGRYSGALPWTYELILFSGPTPLRKILLGTAFFSECHADEKKSFQTPFPEPYPGGDPNGFSLAYYRAIDNVQLVAGGNQESCNRAP